MNVWVCASLVASVRGPYSSFVSLTIVFPSSVREKIVFDRYEATKRLILAKYGALCDPHPILLKVPTAFLAIYFPYTPDPSVHPPGNIFMLPPRPARSRDKGAC